MSRKSLLIIMDGWGHGKVPKSDAIQHANIPYVRSLYETYPHAELMTCGEYVGLPSGQMGNSEVGHLNIGAGRIVYQELQRINRAFETGEFKAHPVFQEMLAYCVKEQKTLHLMGLLSDGGVHAHIEHFMQICDLAIAAGLPRIAIHIFTDGRDTDPKSGLAFVETLERHIQHKGPFIASLSGRFFAMDRDKRWERVQKAYNAMVKGEGVPIYSATEYISDCYQKGMTDEFIEPAVICNEQGQPLARMEDGDAVFCVNFRTDRCREITEVLTQKDFPEWGMKHLPLYYVTMTEYDKSFQGVKPVFKNDDLRNTLGEVLANHGKKQIRIAETEKYPHVTFFFSGGREKAFEGESRILIPSPKEVPTYDLKPEMSAFELTEAILPEIEKGEVDFVCLNFANADMVGHTGVWEAAIKAVETVDQCVARIIPLALKKGYTVFLTADHGNSDYLINEDGSPNTAHTLNPVPFFIISNDFHGPIKNGKLGDIAPTILYLMDLEIPREMNGEVLIK
jgi:2,3-bisphosphoglycerate-independent phosphoglycerate mutase